MAWIWSPTPTCGRRKGIPVSCPLIPTCAMWHMNTYTPHQCLKQPTIHAIAAHRFQHRKWKVIPKIWGVGSQSRKNKTEFSFLARIFRNNMWDLSEYTNQYLNCLTHLCKEKKDVLGKHELHTMARDLFKLNSVQLERPVLVPPANEGLLSWLVCWLVGLSHRFLSKSVVKRNQQTKKP